MAAASAPERVPVLIVGGSLVGLATAIFLAQHGVRALVVERHAGTAIHPRAGHFHLRTLELLRSAGLEEEVQRVSAERYFPNGAINAVRTVAEGEIDSYIADLNQGVEDFSPSRRLFIAQDAIEPLLRRRAEELGARLRYSTEAVGPQEEAEGVRAVLRDRESGAERPVWARYLVAADGSRSPIRQRLGIAMRGYGLLSRSATIYFRADCSSLLEGSNLGVIYVFNDALRGFFRFERDGSGGFLAVNTLGDPTRPGALDVTAGLTQERCADLVRAAIGVPGLPVEIDDVAHWEATADVAERYGTRRTFLVGDAAHALPPNGGFGGNTGIQDAHNLAWKLALAVEDRAGEALLASYDAERQPVGQVTIEQAYTRYARRLTPELGVEGAPPLIDDLSMEIGYRYRSSAVVPDGDENGELVGHPGAAGGRPGTRAPHVWLERGGATVSSLDLFGRSFVLLTGPDGAAWERAAEDASTTVGVPVHPEVLPDERSAEAHGLSESGALLVRPDGFVGWRSRAAVGDPGAALTGALRSILGLA